MTTRAVADDLSVINLRYRGERHNRMAILADVARLYVLCRLAWGIRIVVAAHAASSDVVVIEVRGQPAGRRMAIVTGIAARDVVDGLAGNP